MAEKEILIFKGKTFEADVYWQNKDVIVRKPITAISFATGAPRLTATAHGMTTGMECFVTLVDSPREINAESPNHPSSRDKHPATVIDPNTVELNSVNPVKDSGRPWDAYTSGGFLCYYQPFSLVGATARIDFRDRVGGTLWATSDPAESPLDIVAVTLDDTNKRIRVRIEEDDTAALTVRRGVCELEVHTATGDTKQLKMTSANDDEHDPVRVVEEL